MKIVNCRGDCICGKCICEKPYEGQYCEYNCPIANGRKCAGHGRCDKGICKCDEGFTGEDCGCTVDTDKCQIQVFGK